jgi:guanine deaminase
MFRNARFAKMSALGRYCCKSHRADDDQGLVMTEQTFMQRAVALSLEKMRANSGGPFGAVIVRNGTIISEGWNEVTSHNDPTAHSEIVAIRRACTVLGTFNLPDCDIYTSCEPCPMCLGAIYWARLQRVYFANTRIDASKIGFDDDFIYREVAKAPELRKIPHSRLMTEDAQVAFEEWAASPDKIRY